jgi:hypothetical protein
VDIELTPDDEQALAWAVTTGTRTGQAIRARLQKGDAELGAAEVSAARTEWETAGRPEVQIHHHREPVVLPDGTTVLAASLIGPDPHERADPPDFGLYLDDRWDPPWPHTHAHWPDLGLPVDVDGLRTALMDVVERARHGERVEIGCLGGHGRTGTALACLATLTGLPAGEAVEWVRRTYCGGAVETEEQRAFVERFTAPTAEP